ncbi:MAG: RHS repeat-associated core domain-containing protein [Sphingobacteriaceae bacterium]|nr:RHS repeat-associated core domain-containing protein [Sphingobacteriaceae bacterium]
MKNLGTGTMLLTTNYYDLEGRILQSKSSNHLNGTDVVDNTWNFDGSLKASTRTHTVGGAVTTIANRYEYDHAGRKIATFENINDKGEIALSHLEYNEIGQLSKKNLHNDSQATTFAYNERGWMKNSTSDQFSMELKYNDGTLAQFNGNISGQSYTNGTANTFSYTYDRLNRLTNAAAGNNLGEAISYDVMGNITSLTRDNFGTNNYTGYNGNRLTAISGFTNSSYGYDANGNLTSDSQKDITLGYNFLNLPQTVTGSQNLTYTYNAAGEKLQKQAGGTTTNYIDGIQYTNNSIDFIQTEEGLARRSGNSYNYEYNLSDHLGNVRVTFYQNPTTNQLEVLQRDDYYAFGLRKEPVAKAGLNKYLYNGKELQEELGQYDYGARFYDPVIGRWNIIDPKSELGRRWSPYNYGFNNPIKFVDPDGMWPDPWWIGTLYQVAKHKVQTVFGLKTYADGMMDKAANQMHKQDPDYIKNVPEKTRKINDKVKDQMADTKAAGGLLEFTSTAHSAMGLAMGGVESTYSLNPTVVATKEVSLLTGSEEKSIRSLEKQIVEHTEKLEQYKADPMKFDNNGTLGNTSKELQEKIINGRVKKLEKEIQKFKDNIQKVKENSQR